MTDRRYAPNRARTTKPGVSAVRFLIAGILLVCVSDWDRREANAQTRPHFSQLNDIYSIESNGAGSAVVFPSTAEIDAATLALTSLHVGDIPAGATAVAATGVIVSGPMAVFNGSDLNSGLVIGKPSDYFRIYHDGDHAKIYAARDIHIDPTYGGLVSAVIVSMATIEFADYLGDKIRFYSDSYAIGVSPYDLDIRSDRNIRFHSDTNQDAAVIDGDTGKLTLEGPVSSLSGDNYFAGNVGVATGAPSVRCEINGDCAASDFITLSLASRKANIQNATSDTILNAVRRVREATLRTYVLKTPVEYAPGVQPTLPKYTHTRLGFVADYSGTPEDWIGRDQSGAIKGVVYSRIVPDLVATERHILDRLSALEKRIEELEKEPQ